MNFEDFQITWSRIHGEVELNFIIRSWLRISYLITRPLAFFRISPNALTMTGVVLSVFVWLNYSSILAPIFLLLALVCDGVDGSLALQRNLASSWGAILDAFADRVAEVFWVLAFWELGASRVVLGLAWLAASTQEYVRARMGGLGASQIQVITLAERPVRASILFIALVSVHTHFHLVEVLALFWLSLQLISFIGVISDGYRRLK